jgi:hypothetical protein
MQVELAVATGIIHRDDAQRPMLLDEDRRQHLYGPTPRARSADDSPIVELRNSSPPVPRSWLFISGCKMHSRNPVHFSLLTAESGE